MKAPTGRSRGPVGVALIGAGVISAQYLRTLSGCPDIRLLGIGDLDVGRAREAAALHDIPVAGTVADVLAVPEVEVVVNLTLPAAHTQVARQALAAGKHVYGEKPLALDRRDGAKLLAEAAEAGLRIGSAPDTFLGAGLQSALRAIRSGAIGEPLSAVTAMTTPGPERWHHNPEFLYQAGGGPLLDMGPYYLTALTVLFGRPVVKVAAIAGRARAERVIGEGPRAGTRFPVEVPTDVRVLLQLAGGIGVSSRFSFDSPVKRIQLEITGTEGELRVPDPNAFGGRLLRRGVGDAEWSELPVSGPTAGRGLGVLDLARSLRSGEPPRATGELALHVLDAMEAIDWSATEGVFAEVTTGCPAPEPLPVDWDPAAATLG